MVRDVAEVRNAFSVGVRVLPVIDSLDGSSVAFCALALADVPKLGFSCQIIIYAFELPVDCGLD